MQLYRLLFWARSNLPLIKALLLAALQACDDLVKDELAGRLMPQVIMPGHDLCRIGDPADCLWILQTGNLSH